MGTYFHGNNNNSEVQPSAEGLQLQTLYLMNPNYVLPYSDAAQHPTQNMLLANPNSPHALNLANFTHAPPSLTPQHHALNNSPFHAHYNTNNNLWGSNPIADQTVPATAASASRSNGSECGVTVAATGETEFPSMGFQRGLSLTLSSQQTLPYGNLSSKVDDDREVSVDGVVLGSKYLKAAQELMDEVVNVAAAGGKGICKGESGDNNIRDKRKANIESSSGFGDCSSGGGGGSEVLSTQQRQELQIKKSKLVTMLDEVELRYRQYHNQMQMVVSSFEHAVGFGAAKSYTVLALKTISKQFRSLKDAISSQIRTTSKSLGEDDCLGAKVEGSRLRYVDHHLRQQRALQQLGMIQHNAWRPQRGLPERAVSILRAWLFEHFLHPYPKDSDKVMLARQSGLTRSQVSNWFINARVRLWKPMVEEMYNEEIKEQDQQNDVSHEKTNRSKDSSKEYLWSAANNIAPQEHESFINNQNTSDPTEISNSNNSLSPSPIGGGGGGSFQSHSGFHLADIQRSSPTPKNNSPAGNILSMKHNGESTNRESNKFEGYGTFSMEDIGRFNVTTDHHQLAPRFHGNGVSLTLGLPHNENLPLSASASTQHGFLSQNMHLGGENDEFCAINTTTPPPSGTSNYDQSIDIQNRKRFAAQLLRNFVA